MLIFAKIRVFALFRTFGGHLRKPYIILAYFNAPGGRNRGNPRLGRKCHFRAPFSRKLENEVRYEREERESTAKELESLRRRLSEGRPSAVPHSHHTEPRGTPRGGLAGGGVWEFVDSPSFLVSAGLDLCRP